MQLRTKVILGLAFAAGAAAVARAASRQRHAVTRQGASRVDPASTVAAASGVGIMPIDPEPITQIAGEGIDLDAQVGRQAPLDEVVGRGGYR